MTPRDWAGLAALILFGLLVVLDELLNRRRKAKRLNDFRMFKNERRTQHVMTQLRQNHGPDGSDNGGVSEPSVNPAPEYVAALEAAVLACDEYFAGKGRTFYYDLRAKGRISELADKVRERTGERQSFAGYVIS